MPGDESTGDEFLAEFLDDYFAESDEHLTAVRRILLELEPESGVAGISPAMLEELFRSFHSLKGLAGMVHLRQAELLSHHLESYLRRLRDADGILAAAGVDALIAGTDLLEQVLAARRLGQEPPSIDGVDGASVGARRSAGRSVRPRPWRAAPEQWIVRFAPSPDLVARGITVDRIRTRLREQGEITSATPRIDAAGGISFEFLVTGRLDPDAEIWRDQGVTIERPAPLVNEDTGEAAVTAAPGPFSALAAPPSHFVRVDLARLDELMRLIGDLVITRARLADSLARVERHVPAGRVAGRPGKQPGHRSPPAGSARRRGAGPHGAGRRDLPAHAVRGARPGASADKKVRLEIAGQDTEIDKFLIERMMDPILHLVRNAVSHGLETIAERARRGQDRRRPAHAQRCGRRRHGGPRDQRRRPRHRRSGRGAPRPREGPVRPGRYTEQRGAARHPLRARVLHSRRGRSGERARRRHGRRQEHGAGARRHADARHRPRQRHAVRDRAAADAGHHRRDHRDGRRPDLRGAAVSGA